MSSTLSAQADASATAILRKAHRLLEKHYGRRLAGVVLHGSTARGEAGKESDIDLLVLLRGELDYFAELRRLTDLLYPLQLEADRLMSVLPAPLKDFEAGSLHLYRNAAREGIRL